MLVKVKKNSTLLFIQGAVFLLIVVLIHQPVFLDRSAGS